MKILSNILSRLLGIKEVSVRNGEVKGKLKIIRLDGTAYMIYEDGEIREV